MDNSLTATGKIRTTGDIERQLDSGDSPPMLGLTEGAGGTGTNLLPIFPTLFDFLQHFVFCIGFVVLSLSHKTRV